MWSQKIVTIPVQPIRSTDDLYHVYFRVESQGHMESHTVTTFTLTLDRAIRLHQELNRILAEHVYQEISPENSTKEVADPNS